MKKTFTLLLVLSSIIYAQDKIKYDGKELEGKYIEHDEKVIKFHFKGYSTHSEIPFDRNRLEYIVLDDGIEIDFRTEEEKEKARIDEIRKRAIEEKYGKCEENKKIKMGIIPFKNDMYGLTEEIRDSLRSYCYNIETLEVIKWVNDNIKHSEIGDYNILQAQKELKLDAIVYGYVITEVKHNNYMPSVAPTIINNSNTAKANASVNVGSGIQMHQGNNPWGTADWGGPIANAMIAKGHADIESKRRTNAETIAGTWLIVTVFYIDQNTGEKVFLFKNARLRKL